MKKLIIRLLIALVVVVILAVVAVGLFLDGAIKRGVETFGPRLTKVEIKLQSLHLSLLSGWGTVKGLVDGLQLDLHLGQPRTESFHPPLDGPIQKQPHRHDGENDHHDQCNEQTNDEFLHKYPAPNVL